MKTHRSRCINPKCGRLYRHEQAGSQTCKDAGRQAVYRQRKADNEAEAQAQANAEAAGQEQMRKAMEHGLQLRAKWRAAAAEEERERYQQAEREEAEAERRRPRTAPAADNSVVVLYTADDRYASQMTPIPSKMKPGYL